MPNISPTARADIQGILLSGYGHLDYSRYLFLQVTEPSQTRTWLQTLIPQIATAKPWAQRSDGSREKPDVVINLAFTYPGLSALGLSPEILDSFSNEFKQGIVTPRRSQLLGDTGANAPESWEIGGSVISPLHLLVILHGRDDTILQHQQNTLLQNTDDHLVLVSVESGYRAPSKKEHFGFHDAISQPQIEGVAKNGSQPLIKTGEFILGYLNEYGLYPPTPMAPAHQDPHQLLPDFPDPERPNFKDLGRNGSYLVYCKLAQDVAGFWRYIAAQGKDASGCPAAETMVQIAAKMVGRWPSGTPLVLAPEQDKPQISDKNAFQYLPHDAAGYACPLGAHIRRTNPRDALDGGAKESIKTSRRHRLLRRGTLYGTPLFPLDDVENGHFPETLEEDGQPRGIHFLAINASIERQFEFIQQTWSNNPNFDGLYNDPDPISGDSDGSGSMTIQRQPIRKRLNHLPRFVTVKGGGYFFLPSLTALQFLAQGGYD